MAIRASLLLTLTALLATTFPLPALAGGFRVTDVAYTVWPFPSNDEQIRIIVTSTAAYRWKLDSSDENAIWIINTHLNTSLGGNLYDWEFLGSGARHLGQAPEVPGTSSASAGPSAAPLRPREAPARKRCAPGVAELWHDLPARPSVLL